MKQMKIRIPDATHQSLKVFCAKENVSMQEFILGLLFDFLDDLDRKAEKL